MQIASPFFAPYRQKKEDFFMSEKKVGKRLLTWVLVLVMTLSLLPLNVLAAEGDPTTDSGSGMNFTKTADGPDANGNYTIRMTAQATGKTTTTTEAVPMDIVLVLDQSGSMADDFNGNSTNNNEARRQYAMKEAVNSFIGEVAAKYSDDANHHMAIVTFDDNAKTLVNWTPVNSDGADALTSKISNLPKKPSGATNVGKGMETARTLMNNSEAGAGRLKTVIVFTDGVPTTSDYFDTDVANTAISAAKSMKDSGVTIYTVGIFNGADPDEMYGARDFDVNSDGTIDSKWMKDTWGLFPGTDFPETDRPAGNRFLNLVSSNYPNADSIGLDRDTRGLGILHYKITYKITENFTGTSSNYYLTASNASSLKKIFKDISTTVPEPDNDKLNGDTVITDTLSDYFTFAGTADDVKIYAIDANGREKESADAVKAVATHNGKTVTVTNYDFSAHYKGIGDAEETLVIEIKVKPSGDGYTSANIPTNADTPETHAARVEVEVKSEDGTGTETKVVTSHKTATVNGYSVEYAIGDNASWPNNGNGPEKLYYPQGADVVVTNNVPTREGYKFIGWTPSTDNGAVDAPAISEGKFTMPAANVTLTAQWEKSKYTVTYALTNDVKPSNYSVPADDKAYTKDDEYTVDNTHKAGDKVVEGGYTYTFSGWKLNGTGNVLTGPQTMGNGNVVLKGTWTKTVNKYTVTYKYTGTAPTGAPEVPAAAQHDYDAEVTIENAPTLTGYTFHGWTLPEGLTANGGKFNMPAEPVTITGHWTANTDTKYTVEYYYQNADGSYPATANKTDDRTGTTDATAFVTADDKADKENGKYTYDSTAAANVGSGPIAADGSLTLKLYFKLSKFDYTIEYYYEGENEPFDQTTANVTHGTNVSEVNDSSKLAAHYSRKGVDPELPVTIDKAGIVIRVTYAKAPAGDGTFDFNDVVHGGDKATPAITKTVKGNVGKNFKETFAVTVKGADETSNATMSAASYTGKAEVTYSDLKDIAFKFAENDKLTFRDGGNYTYTVREIPGKTSRMSYDTTEYTLKINVVLDADSNTYQVESWQFTAGNREYPTALNIVNTYRTYHPSTPSKPTLNTGDHYAYVMGYPDGTVRPNGSITRAEVSAILFRLLSDETRDEYFTTESSFTDVKAGAWYNNSIATLEKAGVIVDTAKGGAFRPNEAITRAELAVMLAQFSDAKPVKGVKFSDVSAEHWAYEAIAIAAKMGWIEGYPDGTFRPDATITRAEMMTLVNRALERVPSDEDHLLSKRVMLTFPDCKSGDWFYIAVQEATNSHTYERAATEKNGDEQWTALRANRDWTQLEK